MKRKLGFFARVSIIILVSCMLSSSVTRNYAANLDEEKKKQQELQKELKDTQKLLNELESQKGDVEAYISSLDKRMIALDDNISTLQESIAAKKAVIEQTKADIDVAITDINTQYDAMKLRIQYMYENGESSYVSMVLGSSNMSDFLSRAEYLSQITAYDREQLKKLQAAKIKLDEDVEKLLGEEADLESTLAEVNEEKAATDKLLDAKKELLNGYKNDISNANDDVDRLEDDIAAQKAIVAELEAIEKKRKEEEAKKNQANKLTYDGGKMIWPIPGYSRLSSYYGTRPDPFGKPTQEYHSGIDVPAPKGTEIIAAYDGEVAWSYLSSSAGNWVGIDHGNGLYTVYMHMSKRIAVEGQKVKKGDVIGLVGTTGRSTGNHLHFGVRKDGEYVDPLDWVSP